MIDNKEPLTEVIYPESVETYSTRQMPQKQSEVCKKLACAVSTVLLSCLRKGYKIEKVNIENLEPPYILL